MSLTSVVSWSLVSGYKTLLGAGRDPRHSPTSKGSTEAQKAVMEHLQTLLLSLLLVMCPPASATPSIADYPWKWKERGGEAKAASRAHPTPYMAYLQGKDKNFCGGFLVAPSWVMTAAQCLVHKPLTVILGAHTLQRREDSWQTFEVKEYHCHPGFTSPKKGNDILLLKLNGNATSNSHVRPISFEKSKVRGGSECSVAGWGYRTATVTLREATVTVIRQRDCLSHYPGLADNLICGRSRSSGVPEKGDAGDPLVCNNKAYGIFSYRHNNWPGFYTHIAPFLPWVNSVMKSA
ncbi:granzyme E-like [Cyanistes caeruleus]|uniref:granzyme E-like n=1 Tax=Cyanistes caeruleus TaxID=156563 RepID=UPI000CDB547B|nr:granzyme E-like [Cyanistes caeruleus]